MQRISALLPARTERTKSVDGKTTAGNGGWFGWSIAASKTTTINVPTKFGREVYWPAPLDKECEKAARILKSFCTDGFLANDEPDSVPASPTTPAPTTTIASVTKKIPPRIIQNAAGLAIFSCMRSGLWMSGSGGSGILIARKADGTWSPPSGILLHTTDLGFLLGVDIYDCVLVINSVSALELFTRPRVTLGNDVDLTVGPLVPMAQTVNTTKWKDLDNTVLTYLKARGQHRAVALDGSLVTERGNENERFYSAGQDVLDILAGNVRKDIPEIQPLFEAIKAAEGRSDFDPATMRLLSEQPAPGDAVIETPTLTPLSPTFAFGLPSPEDPDPFGVLALEMAGLEIKEAGSRNRPTSTQFEYAPSPTSPVFGKFSRQSIDTFLTRSNRGSYMSSRTQATTVTDACTQTDVGETPDSTPGSSHSDDGKGRASPYSVPEVVEPEDVDFTKIDMSVIRHLSDQSLDAPARVRPAQTQHVETQTQTEQKLPVAAEVKDKENVAVEAVAEEPEDDDDADADDEDDEDDEEEPVIYEVATTQPTRTAIVRSQATKVVSVKGALVNIPKRIPPPLPIRSPARTSRASKSEYGDVTHLRSPLRSSFQTDRTGSAMSNRTDESSAVLEPATLTAKLEAVSVEAKSAHRRDSSSMHTAVEAPMQRSSTDSLPGTASRPQTGAPSSADDSDYPRTPKPEDDSRTEAEKPAKAEVKVVDTPTISLP